MKRNKFLAFFVFLAMMIVGLTACNIDLNAAKINIKTPATKTMYGNYFLEKILQRQHTIA